MLEACLGRGASSPRMHVRLISSIPFMVPCDRMLTKVLVPVVFLFFGAGNHSTFQVMFVSSFFTSCVLRFLYCTHDSQKKTAHQASLIACLCDQASALMKSFDDSGKGGVDADECPRLLRFCSQRQEIMITPGKDFSLVVLRKLNG